MGQFVRHDPRPGRENEILHQIQAIRWYPQLVQARATDQHCSSHSAFEFSSCVHGSRNSSSRDLQPKRDHRHRS
jgi:hypothetical protein